jgi:hypothetical protein
MAKRRSVPKHTWAFAARFRRNAFGWRSSLPVKRVKEAVSEIKKVARKDPALGAEGAVLFLEKVSPALEHVDGSSGSMGTAVNHAIAALVPIISQAPADPDTRAAWLERLWTAYLDDGMPYIEALGDSWGELCASKETASAWANRLTDPSKLSWTDRRPGSSFKGTTNCLSAYLAAERYDELLELLELEPHGMWWYRQFGVRALAAKGEVDLALRYADEYQQRSHSPAAVAGLCEEILLAADRADEAYARYGLQANQATTYLAWFRQVTKRYPHKAPADVLADLVQGSPGAEGKWFAAAKSAELYDEAIALANGSPCDPKTLTRAARDFADEQPAFALEAGMAALRWLAAGHGYEITSVDVLNAYTYTRKAADNAGTSEHTQQRIRALVAGETSPDRPLTRALGGQLGLA